MAAKEHGGIARRTVLGGAVATGALSVVGGLPMAGCSDDEEVKFHRFAKTWPAPKATSSLEPLERAASWIESTPRSRIFERWAEAVQGGESPETLLRALWLASIRNLQAFPGGVYHVPMMWASMDALAPASSGARRPLAQLFMLDHFKEAQEERPGVLPLEPAAPSEGPDLTGELDAAYVRWDVSAAEAALLGLHRRGGREAVIPVLFHNAVRDVGHIGHGAVGARQLVRALDHVGWQEAEPALRSVLRMQFFIGEGGTKPDEARLAPWARNAERAHALAAVTPGPTSDGAALELVAAFRELAIDEGVAEVARRMADGLPAQTVWDAVSLFCAEMLLQDTGKGKTTEVHLTTHANAARAMSEALASAEARMHVLLQSVATTLATRDETRHRVSRPALLRIDTLERDAAATPAVEAIFDGLASAASFEAKYAPQLRAARRALAFLADGGAPDALMAAASENVVTKGREAHWYKFPAAVFEDQAKLTAAFRARVLAASAVYLPGTADADWRRLDEARRTLAGI